MQYLEERGVGFDTRVASDGDAIFSLATGAFAGDFSLSALGALAAEAMAEAIVRAARQAEGSHGVPAARDLLP